MMPMMVLMLINYEAGFWVMAKSDSAHRHGVMMNDDAVGDDDDCDDRDYGAGGDG